MNAADLFHVGVVTDDFERTLAELSALFGYDWCAEVSLPLPVTLPTGDTVIDLRFTYSRTTPRVEVVQSIPGTVWTPASGSGIHHLGYWSDDVAADVATLERNGLRTEATGNDPDGVPKWTYSRRDDLPRIELVSRTLQPGLEGYWAS